MVSILQQIEADLDGIQDIVGSLRQGQHARDAECGLWARKVSENAEAPSFHPRPRLIDGHSRSRSKADTPSPRARPTHPRFTALSLDTSHHESPGAHSVRLGPCLALPTQPHPDLPDPPQRRPGSRFGGALRARCRCVLRTPPRSRVVSICSLVSMQ